MQNLREKIINSGLDHEFIAKNSGVKVKTIRFFISGARLKKANEEKLRIFITDFCLNSVNFAQIIKKRVRVESQDDVIDCLINWGDEKNHEMYKSVKKIIEDGKNNKDFNIATYENR